MRGSKSAPSGHCLLKLGSPGITQYTVTDFGKYGVYVVKCRQEGDREKSTEWKVTAEEKKKKERTQSSKLKGLGRKKGN